ncbi:MAG: PAS domain S-box-containing protein [Cyclobacteriaceae bacterium]
MSFTAQSLSIDVAFMPEKTQVIRHVLRLTIKSTELIAAHLISVDAQEQSVVSICAEGTPSISIDDLVNVVGIKKLLSSKKIEAQSLSSLQSSRGQVNFQKVSKTGQLSYLLVTFHQGTLSDADAVEVSSLVDIIKLQIQEKENINRESSFRQLVEQLGDMIFELDENGFFVYVNPAILQQTKYSESEFYKMRYRDIMESNDAESVESHILAQVKKTKASAYLECKIKTKAGKKLDIGLNMQFAYEAGWVIRTYIVAREITGIVQAKKKLMESEEKFRLISENSQDMIAIHDLDGKYKYVSPIVTKLLGYQAEDLIGISPYDLTHPDDLIRIFDGSSRAKLLEESFTIDEYRFKGKDNEYRWFQSYTKPIWDDTDNLTAFQSFSRDITLNKTHEEQFKKADEQLNHYKEGLKLLNEITSNTALTQDQQINQALWASTEFLGMETGVLSEITGQSYQIKYIYGEASGFKQSENYPLEETFSEVIYRKNNIISIEEISKTTFKVHPCHRRFQLEAFIGMPYFVAGKKRGTITFSSPEGRTEPFSDNDLEYIKLLSRWIGFILQHQEYEQNLMQDKIILQAFVSNAPAAIAMFDKEMRYITASDKWYDDYGLENEYIIGKSYFELFPDIGQDWETIFKKALDGSIEFNEQDLIEKADGTIQWIKWEVRPWYKALDTVGGLIMFTEDISLQKEQQLQLKIAKRKAEQASKAKEQFLSTMSHEIRTPLNAIIGMTEVMLMDDQEPEQLKRLDLLKFSGENLLVLINDILDFNKIEAGKLEFEIENFDLKSLLEKITESMMSIVDKKNLSFEVTYDPELPEFVKGDSVRVAQIITNLVNNAIKFTEVGGITLKARCVHRTKEICNVKFEVKDTGIGIAKNKLETIFQSFEQANTAITRKYGGSGLGLAITKKILALLGSKIQVHSKEGVGSTFFFELDLPIGEGVHVERDTAPQAAIRDDIHLLVAEDNNGNRILIESLFKKWDISFDFAFDGKQAFEKIQLKHYDMVLMDLQMPEMDGYEATKAIRNLPSTKYREIPIIALTASVMSNVLEKTKEVGMNGYVSKPYSPKDLKNTIAEFTSGVGSEKEVQEDKSLSDFPYLTSLIGDDPNTLKEIIKTTVESVENARVGIINGLQDTDVEKVRSELHVLRPNLHNLELGALTAHLPKIREITAENSVILRQLTTTIEKKLLDSRITKYIA